MHCSMMFWKAKTVRDLCNLGLFCPFPCWEWKCYASPVVTIPAVSLLWDLEYKAHAPVFRDLLVISDFISKDQGCSSGICL